MNEPSFYGFPVFGEPAVKVAQDAGGQVTTADGRSFETDEDNRERVLEFVRDWTFPRALGRERRVKTCLYTQRLPTAISSWTGAPDRIGSSCASGPGTRSSSRHSSDACSPISRSTARPGTTSRCSAQTERSSPRPTLRAAGWSEMFLARRARRVGARSHRGAGDDDPQRDRNRGAPRGALDLLRARRTGRRGHAGALGSGSDPRARGRRAGTLRGALAQPGTDDRGRRRQPDLHELRRGAVRLGSRAGPARGIARRSRRDRAPHPRVRRPGARAERRHRGLGTVGAEPPPRARLLLHALVGQAVRLLRDIGPEGTGRDRTRRDRVRRP